VPADHPDDPSLPDAEGVCADARRARQAVETSHELLRGIRRTLVDAGRIVEAAARDADRHAVGDKKSVLASDWQHAMDAAASPDDRRQATATWMRQISDVNTRTRAAIRQLAAGRAQVAALEARLRTADLEAAAVRIRAETLEAACAEARRTRAVHDERSVAADGWQRVEAAAAAGVAAGEGPVAGAADDDPALRPASYAPLAADSETVRRLLTGDVATHQVLASELAEMSGRLPARYLLLLDTLVDELAAAAVDAGELAFDHDHPLWGQFSADDARLVVRGLRDLGFRLDIHEGWFGGRAPTTSDLASALGFAGHDVRALRGIPSATALQDLPKSVQVAAHDHLRRMAPDLTLDQMARALGPRAARLGDLWDEWGRVRPLLASGLRTPA